MDLTIEKVEIRSEEEIFDDLKENKKVRSFSDVDTMLFLNEGMDRNIDSFIKIYTRVPYKEKEVEDFKFLLKQIAKSFVNELVILETILYDGTEEKDPTEEEWIEEVDREVEILNDIDFIDINKYYGYITRNLFVYNDGPGLEFAFNINNFLNHQEKENGNSNNK